MVSTPNPRSQSACACTLQKLALREDTAGSGDVHGLDELTESPSPEVPVGKPGGGGLTCTSPSPAPPWCVASTPSSSENASLGFHSSLTRSDCTSASSAPLVR